MVESFPAALFGCGIRITGRDVVPLAFPCVIPAAAVRLR
jgi:hypothetical protein